MPDCDFARQAFLTTQEVINFGDDGRRPGRLYGRETIATGSKGNVRTTEACEGKWLHDVGLEGVDRDPPVQVKVLSRP